MNSDTVFPSPDADFERWRDGLPATHWARYDLSACRLGWDARAAFSSPPEEPSEERVGALPLEMLDELMADLTRWDRMQFGGTKQFQDGVAKVKEVVRERLRRIRAALSSPPQERVEARPDNCRNRLRDEGKAYPKSGCYSCGDGGLRGCPFERERKP
jgi:hypothetical protein